MKSLTTIENIITNSLFSFFSFLGCAIRHSQSYYYYETGEEFSIKTNRCTQLFYGLMPISLLVVINCGFAVMYGLHDDYFQPIKNIVTLNMSGYKILQTGLRGSAGIIAIIAYGTREEADSDIGSSETWRSTTFFSFLGVVLFLMFVEAMHANFYKSAAAVQGGIRNLTARVRARAPAESSAPAPVSISAAMLDEIKEVELEERKKNGENISIWEGGTGTKCFRPVSQNLRSGSSGACSGEFDLCDADDELTNDDNFESLNPGFI